MRLTSITITFYGWIKRSCPSLIISCKVSEQIKICLAPHILEHALAKRLRHIALSKNYLQDLKILLCEYRTFLDEVIRFCGQLLISRLRFIGDGIHMSTYSSQESKRPRKLLEV